MPPDLVVANAAYKIFPGGVVVLRCSDWMAGARGTLSSEVDARAITGQAVRDSQQVATSIYSDTQGAFEEADDTLVIDLASLPLLADMSYYFWLSLLIEGDWDTSTQNTYRGSTQQAFSYACNLAMYEATYGSTATRWEFAHKPRGKQNYWIVGASAMLPTSGGIVGDEELHIRALAQTGTTVEFLLDQAFFVPYVIAGTRASEWKATDFQDIPGSEGDLQGTLMIDGVDGGDSNGKYTWFPYSFEQPVSISTSDPGGGDYQRKASGDDGEYLWNVLPTDNLLLWNSQTNSEASAIGYSILGAYYTPAATWADDPFSRTITIATPLGGGTWDRTPEGFGYSIGAYTTPTAPLLGANGSEGVIQFQNIAISQAISLVLKGVSTAAEMDDSPDLIYSGEFYFTSLSTSGTLNARLGFLPNPYTNGELYYIDFDAAAASWTINYLTPGGGVALNSPVDVSGWFGANAPVGFKIELRRYLLRAKVWDASGAEPGAWDYEDFRPLPTSWASTTVWFTYPYDSVYRAELASEPMAPTVSLECDHPTGVIDFRMKWLKVEYDPGGDIADVYGRMETPEGSSVGDIQVPNGAWHAVYWGLRDWTGLDGGFPYLEVSAKSWNDPSAAELQRAEVPFAWFRSNHLFIIPMNWRSSMREGGWKRILKGNS